MIDYNIELLNNYDLGNSFFQLSKSDPTLGFHYDATSICGATYPAFPEDEPLITASPAMSVADASERHIYKRLLVGSHLARYLRFRLEEGRGYTATVGISTSKLLSKLVGNVNKPNNQTTLVPPYNQSNDGSKSSVTAFIDDHDIGAIPGLGFKLAQKIRDHVLSRPADFSTGLIYGYTKESVPVRDVRRFPSMGPDLLAKLLAGPGSPQGIGSRAWGLINGVDDAEVSLARNLPRQISIEDSYIRLDTLDQATKVMKLLAASLIKRMHVDLLEDEDHEEDSEDIAVTASPAASKRWIAHPRTLRLSTRPRQPLRADGTRARSFARVSRSGPLPAFIFNISMPVSSLAEKLTTEALMPLFRKLHPEKSGWNLSLVNVCVTDMVEGEGRNIGKMFKDMSKSRYEWMVEDIDVPPDRIMEDIAKIAVVSPKDSLSRGDSEDPLQPDQDSPLETIDLWEDDEENEDGVTEGDSWCSICESKMPSFAMSAHNRFHNFDKIPQ